MLAVIFAVTILIVLTAHYVFIGRPRQREARADDHRPQPVALWRAMGRLPTGIFLQPTYTWSRIDPSGQLDIGLHPMLLGLVGPRAQLELLSDGTRVGKGATLAWLRVADRTLTIRSPVSGTIRVANHSPTGEPSWSAAVGEDGSWLYRMEPEALGDEVPSWMIGDRAAEWTRQTYGQIRGHLLAAGFRHEPSPLLADGGDVPVGILADLDEAEWEAFQDLFLEP